MHKTAKGWHNSGKNLSEYLQPSDTVDEALYSEMRDCLPPITLGNGLMQVGEPYTHINGKPTYATFKKVSDDTWEYCGHCFEGEPTDQTYEAIKGPVYEYYYFDITKINWRLLTMQKRALIRQIDYHKFWANSLQITAHTMAEQKEQERQHASDAELLEGLVQVIEDMQDCAVDTWKVPKWMVFGPLPGDPCRMIWKDEWEHGWQVVTLDLTDGSVGAKRANDKLTPEQGGDFAYCNWKLWYENQ